VFRLFLIAIFIIKGHMWTSVLTFSAVSGKTLLKYIITMSVRYKGNIYKYIFLYIAQQPQ